MVFRPGGEEVIAFGTEISNSDFGAGALSVRCFVLRVWCTNYARLEEELRKVHLGSRLDESLELSERTYALDAQATSSAVRDIVVGSMAPGKINDQVALIEKAMSERIDFKRSLDSLRMMGLLKREVEAVRDVLTIGGIETLPSGNSPYRLANAISWAAKSADSPERRLELEQIAGHVLIGSRVQAVRGNT